MQLTPNLNLKKPEGTDVVNIEDLNKNADVLDTTLGNMSTVPTNSKTVAGAITELFTNVSDGKNSIAAAITDMNQSASETETFSQLAAKIKSISNDANASEGQVLSGRTFYQGGQKRTGTMPNYSNGKITGEYTTSDVGVAPHASGGNYLTVITKPRSSGYVTQNTVIETWIHNLTAEKIQAGVTVGPSGGLRVTGTFTSDANAVAADIRSGKTAYVNGNKITGTMTNRGGHTDAVSVGRSNNVLYFRIPHGAYTTNASGQSYPEIRWTENNLTASNIRRGVSLFGLLGTLDPIRTASGTASIISGGTGSYAHYRDIVVTGLTFRPKAFYAAVQHNRTWFSACYEYGSTRRGFSGYTDGSDNIWSFTNASFSITPSGSTYTVRIRVAADSNVPLGTQVIWEAVG